jgi:broad specificity phosphatase PhoE
MRHGESKANEANLIISRPGIGATKKYSLTNRGNQQVKASAVLAEFRSKPIIYTSIFSRAFETARIMQQQFSVDQIRLSANLRERSFGQFDGLSIANYGKVWRHDVRNTLPLHSGIETVEAVLSRLVALIAIIESEHTGKDILLVSHGDPLQILQCAFLKIPPSRHRELPHLAPAEIRELSA